jgi:hypothetical protein
MIDTTAKNRRGMLIIKGGSLISSFDRLGFKGPKNILFTDQKV